MSEQIINPLGRGTAIGYSAAPGPCENSAAAPDVRQIKIAPQDPSSCVQCTKKLKTDGGIHRSCSVRPVTSYVLKFLGPLNEPTPTAGLIVRAGPCVSHLVDNGARQYASALFRLLALFRVFALWAFLGLCL
jgi:hypothetical protein